MPVTEFSEMKMPHSIDTEQAVLGAILLNPEENMAAATTRIGAEHFYVKLHKSIFSVMSRMFSMGQMIDIVTVQDNCLKEHVFDTPEQAQSYLVKLMESVPTISSIGEYLKILDENFTRRQLITVAGDILDNVGDAGNSPSSLLELAERKIYEIRNENEVRGLTRINSILVDILGELQQLVENPVQNRKGLASGFPALDRKIHGLNNSNLLIIAARPGMGKTSFALNIAVNAAVKNGNKAVCIFNLEMSKEEIVTRMLCSEGLIENNLMKSGMFTPAQWRNLYDASTRLSALNIYIDDGAALTVNEIKAKLRRIDNLGLVVIDYLQLMSTGRRDLNRVNEISEITRSMKIMAKELNVPVITLSQLSRTAEKKDNKEPMLSDLRDSGSIEQDADIVLFLYRDSYYDKEAEDKRACKCIVAKNRHGETGDIRLCWDGQYTRFTDVEYIYEDPRGQADN